MRVFVVSFDDASVIHAKNALQNGTPWTIVDDKAAAQFIVRFVYAGIGFGDKKGKAQFLDPKTEAVVFEIGSVNTTMSWDRKVAVFLCVIQGGYSMHAFH